MKTIYVSFEQELVIRDQFGINAPGGLTDDPYHHGYVVISRVPWGSEPEGWLPDMIGPMHDQQADDSVAGVVRLLANLGYSAITPDTSTGQWHGEFYSPHASEATS